MLVASCGECVFRRGEIRCVRFPEMVKIIEHCQADDGQPDHWCGEFKPRKRGEWKFPTADPRPDLLDSDALASLDEAQRKIDAVWAGDAQDVSDLGSDLHGPKFDPAAVREYARRTGRDVPLGPHFHEEHCPMSRETGARPMTGCACDLPVKRILKP